MDAATRDRDRIGDIDRLFFFFFFFFAVASTTHSITKNMGLKLSLVV